MAADFKTRQAEFAGYIRDPHRHPAPGDVDVRRMAMYRELFFNNIDSFLSSNFPVLHRLLTQAQWQALSQDFYARHSCQTPYFSEIAEEFLDYLHNEREATDDYPFLLELAHYEWVEMALSIAKAEPRRGDENFIADIVNRRIALSPLAWPLVYQYPVERISPDFLPTEAPIQPTCLIVYRDSNDEVQFMQTTPLTIGLLQLVADNGNGSAMRILQTLANQAPQLDPQALAHYGQQTLQELAAKGIIIPADAD